MFLHHSHIDRYAQGDSPIHRLDARAKLLAVLAYTAVVISFNRYALLALAPLSVLPLAMLWLGGIPLRFAVRRVLILCPFILALCLAMPFYDASAHVIRLGPRALLLSGGTLTALNIAIKFALTVLALTALTSTTPFASMLEGMRRLGCPRAMSMMLGFLYRYLFVLLDEAMRLRRGRDFRGAAMASVRRRLAAVGGMIGSLFVRTLERSDRVALAMAARGFRGESHGLSVLAWSHADAIWLILVAGYLVFCRAIYPLLLLR